MNSRAENRTSGSITDLGDDVFQLPWSGWEEDISEIHLPLLTVEDELLDAHLKTEYGSALSAGHDVTNAIGYDINDAFPGMSIDVQTLFGSSEDIDLQELFDNIDVVQAETNSPLLHLLEESNAKPISLMEPSIQSLADYGNEVMLDTVIEGLWNPDGEEEVCVTSVGDSEQCDASLDESDSREDLSTSVSGSSRYRGAYAESSAEESSVDDKDWTITTRKRKRNGKTGSRCNVNEPRRKLRKSDPRTRKKEQNRNAATRYREKKKQMDNETQAAIELLEVRNRELKKEIQDKEHEVFVMRQLLVDILRPK